MEFRRRFGGIAEMQAQHVAVGGVAVLRFPTRFVYALVTKETSRGCWPTLADLRASLVALRQHVQRNGVKRLAVPRLGCGLDKMKWSDVLPTIVHVFKDTDIDILVFSL